MNELVSLVIPGRNCAGTLHECLNAACVLALEPENRLYEIIFVDDGSRDDSAKIAAAYGVKVLSGPGGGPGAARNIGWRAAENSLIWFIDSDCIARPDALALLLPHEADEKVGGVGGSYDNMRPDSLLACLVHEEIALRHQRMAGEKSAAPSVNFLGGFNVLYRREALERAGGFDERFFNGPGSPGAEDAELSWRVQRAGYDLRFEHASRVGHYHPTRFWRYLRTQRHHGYWRVFLHFRYRDHAAGDDYSSIVDHLQPPLAMLALTSLPLIWAPLWRWIPIACLGLLAIAQLPLTLRIFNRTKQMKYLLFAPLGFARAFARGIGMVQGIIAYPWKGRERKTAPETRTQVEA